MRKFRIGVVVDFELKKEEGGAFSYHNSLIKGIDNYPFDASLEIIFILFSANLLETEFKKETLVLNNQMNSISDKKTSKSLKNYLPSLKKNRFVKHFYAQYKQKKIIKISKKLENFEIDLLYYLKPTPTIFEIPYLITHWDLAHKTTFPFPEIAMNGNYEGREIYHAKVLNKALLILCESETSIKELKALCSFDQKKLALLPLFGNEGLYFSNNGEEINTYIQKFNLKTNEFFLYPAQFWSHKNHYNLILAFNKFIHQNPQYAHIKLVLCGADKGNLSYIAQIVNDFKISQSILFTGFICDRTLQSLYKNAIALIFPSFLGPTNMPLIEAARLNCPVLCSNLEGHKEILGEHALYFDPLNHNEISAAMLNIVTNQDLRTSLIDGAAKHISSSKFQLKNSLSRLNDIFIKAMSIRKTWHIINKNKNV